MVIFHILDYVFFPANVVVGRGHLLWTALLDIPVAFIVSVLFYLLLIFFRFRRTGAPRRLIDKVEDRRDAF